MLTLPASLLFFPSLARSVRTLRASSCTPRRDTRPLSRSRADPTPPSFPPFPPSPRPRPRRVTRPALLTVSPPPQNVHPPFDLDPFLCTPYPMSPAPETLRPAIDVRARLGTTDAPTSPVFRGRTLMRTDAPRPPGPSGRRRARPPSPRSESGVDRHVILGGGKARWDEHARNVARGRRCPCAQGVEEEATGEFGGEGEERSEGERPWREGDGGRGERTRSSRRLRAGERASTGGFTEIEGKGVKRGSRQGSRRAVGNGQAAEKSSEGA